MNQYLTKHVGFVERPAFIAAMLFSGLVILSLNAGIL